MARYKILEEGVTIGENVYNADDEAELTLEDAEKYKDVIEEINPEELPVGV